MKENEPAILGRPVQQVDAVEKVTGTAKYAADFIFPRALEASVVRSPVAHAKIKRINVEQALKLPGVRAIVKGTDVPFRYNMPLRDQPFLAIDRVRYVGEPVVAIAADDVEIAKEAAGLVEIEYEPLAAVFDPVEAMTRHAPRIHPEFETYTRDATLFEPVADSNILNHFKLRRGDVEVGFEEADGIFEGTYHNNAFDHAAMEPHASTALFERSGQLTIWTSQQSPHIAANDLSIALNMPMSKIRLISPYLGGGFGAKHGLKMEPIAVALAMKLPGRHVRAVMSREDVFTSTVVSGAVHVKLRTGVTRDGRIVARKAEVIWDTGAYADVGPLLCRNGSYSANGPYNIPHQWIDGYCVYTNKMVAGGFRGYGIMEMAFAYESQMDEIARYLAIDPVEIRRRNLLDNGDVFSTGDVLHAVGLKPAMNACVEAMGWDRSEPKVPNRGRAIVTTAKSSVAPSGSTSFIQMNNDGTINVLCSTTEMGQGSRTVMAQLAAEAVGARLEDVTVVASDTAVTPPDRSTSSSRSTFNMGNAIVRAGSDVRAQILQKAAEFLGEPVENLEVTDSAVFVRDRNKYCRFADIAGVRPASDKGPIVGRGTYVPDYATPFDLKTGQGCVVAFWLYSSQGVELEVDPETGIVKILKVVSVHDTGRTLNPTSCIGQTEGGVLTAISAALLEEIVLDGNGAIRNPAFESYLIATSADAPPIEALMIEVPDPRGPFGAKGMAEGPTTGIAAAIANAIEDAIGVRIRELPITPEKILRALGKIPSLTN